MEIYVSNFMSKKESSKFLKPIFLTYPKILFMTLCSLGYLCVSMDLKETFQLLHPIISGVEQLLPQILQIKIIKRTGGNKLSVPV